MTRPKEDRQALVASLARVVIDTWEEEEQALPEFWGDEPVDGQEDSVREMIEAFIKTDYIPTKGGLAAQGVVMTMQKMMRRVLDVDMTLPANRKGDLPRVMGLASRKNDYTRLRDQVIYHTFDHARYNTGKAGRPLRVCAALVLDAFDASGKYNLRKILKKSKKETPEVAVINIYRRLLEGTSAGTR